MEQTNLFQDYKLYPFFELRSSTDSKCKKHGAIQVTGDYSANGNYILY